MPDTPDPDTRWEHEADYRTTMPDTPRTRQRTELEQAAYEAGFSAGIELAHESIAARKATMPDTPEIAAIREFLAAHLDIEWTGAAIALTDEQWAIHYLHMALARLDTLTAAVLLVLAFDIGDTRPVVADARRALERAILGEPHDA